MLRDILYHLQTQIETHMYNYAGRGDLRILMSERQLCEMERLMWQDQGISYYGHQPARGPEPARFYGVEIVPTVMDMPVPQVVRLASI